MNIAVTGSSGFIGKYLVKAIQNTIQSANLIEIDSIKGIDILNKDQLDQVGKIDTVVHLAAKSYVPDSFENPHSFYYTNVVGTLNILELCRKNKAKCIMISSYVYGSPMYLPIDEKHIVQAFNPYGQSKLMCESLCEGYYRDFGVPSIIFRPFNVYGDGQNTNFLIPSVFKQIREGRRDIILKDPIPKRDFVFIEDVVVAILRIIKTDFRDFDVFNICSGESFSVREVTQMINRFLKNKVNFIFEEGGRKNEVIDIKGNLSKISKILGWSPEYSLENGLKFMIDQYDL